MITDVAGLTVGQAQTKGSGVSIVVGDAPMVAGVHVMGGAPGTRETDLLKPDAMVGGVDALVLSGGSAFGIASADGVVRALADDGRGFEAAGHRVPIVPAAILFDLPLAGNPSPDYAALGAAAYAARGRDVSEGSVGAGTGATVARWKGGIGTASTRLPDGVTVGALVAVNALGEVTAGNGPHFWAAPFEQEAEFGGLGPLPGVAPPPQTKLDSFSNTTIAVVATDATLTKAEATRMAIAAHDGIARAIVPAHTPFDGDLVFACSTARHDPTDPLQLGHAGAECLARAIARAVYHATPVPNGPPTWRETFDPLP